MDLGIINWLIRLILLGLHIFKSHAWPSLMLCLLNKLLKEILSRSVVIAICNRLILSIFLSIIFAPSDDCADHYRTNSVHLFFRRIIDIETSLGLSYLCCWPAPSTPTSHEKKNYAWWLSLSSFSGTALGLLLLTLWSVW